MQNLLRSLCSLRGTRFQRARLLGVRFTMRVCPHCEAELTRSLVRNRWAGGIKWYQYSSAPFIQQICSVCENRLIREYNKHWIYSFGFPLLLLPSILRLFLGEELDNIIRLAMILIAILGFLIVMKKTSDYRYISPKDQTKKRVKELIKHAKGDIQNPIESSEFCIKYSLEKNELNQMISMGLIEAYAIDGIEFLEDKEPENET